MSLQACYYGSVNRWECDENDHLNVRFYAQKVNQATEIFLREVAGTAEGRTRVASQHIRFVRESRIATPLRVDCGLLSATDGGCEVLSLMVNNLTGEPVAGFISRLERPGLDAVSWPERVAAPEWAAPRGLDPAAPYPLPGNLDAALEAGFQTMGRGVIGAEECDASGVLLPHAYIGRISDGMPNLWAFTTDVASAAARQGGDLGGAALEYRLDLFEPLRAGDAFRHVSGIRAVGNKTQHMVHLLWNETRSQMALRAEAIGVAMDLDTRRAVPISDARRAELQRLMLRS